MLWPNAQKHGSMDDPGVTLYTDPFTKCGCELVRLRVAQTDKKKILKSRFSGKDGLAKSRCPSSESSRQQHIELQPLSSRLSLLLVYTAPVTTPMSELLLQEIWFERCLV